MAEITERLGDLSSGEQRALLAQLLKEKAQKPKFVLPSFAQERMGFLSQLRPDNPGFNILAAIRLTGRLDVAALKKSLDEIARRQEILRTTFTIQNGRLTQVIAPTMTIVLPVIDLRELPKAERESHVRQLVIRENQRPFDIFSGPLFRANLLRLDEDEHAVFLNAHHIIFDGWSEGVLKRELAVLYQAFSNGRPSPIPELAIQYADFAEWQRQYLQADVLERQLAYWKRQLAGPLPVLELLADGPRAAARVPTRVRRTQTLPLSLAETFKALCQREGVTLYMALLAAFKVLLYRYTGQTDIIVGSPVTHRDRAELERMIGLFLNTLVLRTDLAGDPTFVELLGRVRRTVLDAFAHKDLPFERLVEELEPERNVNRNPFFQVIFVLQDPSTFSLEQPGLKLSPYPVEVEVEEDAPNLLGLSVWEAEEGLVLSLGYRTELLTPNILGHLQTLIASIVSDPRQRLSALPFYAGEERRQLLAIGNKTRKSYPQDQCFHQLFEAQVGKTLDSIAAICDEAHLTYRRLDRRANRLASILVEHNVGPDVVVALLAGRGLDFLTAMLAVFKAGGAYLPLDPRHPVQRLLQVLGQSQSPLVLAADEFAPTLSDALAALPIQARPVVLCLSELLRQECSEDSLPTRCTPRHLAYVIYTSGSTGVPKGAMVEQRGMINHLYAKIGDLDLKESDILAQTATQTFDISVWQFLACLLVGGCVCIFGDEIAHDPSQLFEQAAYHQVTVLETVPSLMRVMLEQIAQPDSVSFNLTLRWLIPTGEVLPPDLARQWLSRYPHTPLVNAYGPTECSDDVTHYPMFQPPAAEAIRTPIGRPIANMRLYVLDARLEPAPIGVAGELYIGGDGVGRGYLYEPRKTAETFIPDPFSAETGSRLYKTGDLAFWHPGGNLEFLGRIDYQVKVRGFRIELGEIETTLEQHPQVRQTVVIAQDAESAPGERRLVAYVVPKQTQSLAVDEIYDFMNERLPDYMVPSAFVLLDALPLTPSGKVDRKALPAPDGSLLARTKDYVPPRDPLEQRLAEIWAQVLGIEKVGRHDNFFELGGHSLLVTPVVYRINQAFQIRLSVRNFFEEPTIAGLALLIKEILIEELEKEE